MSVVEEVPGNDCVARRCAKLRCCRSSACQNHTEESENARVNESESGGGAVDHCEHVLEIGNESELECV